MSEQYQEQVSTAVAVGSGGRALFNLLNPVWVKLKQAAVSVNLDSGNPDERTLRLRVLDAAGNIVYDVPLATNIPGSASGPWQWFFTPAFSGDVLVPPLGAVAVDELSGTGETIVSTDQVSLVSILEY